MREDIGDNQSFTIAIVAVLVTGLIASLGGCALCEQTKQKAIEKGLVQQWDPSTRQLIWVMVEPKDRQ